MDLSFRPTAVFFGGLFFFGIPIVSYINKINTYRKTEYRFYPTKLDYYEGFFTVEEKTIDFSKITEVHLRKGVFQRMYGLGTIIISTATIGSGIKITDIEDPDGIYQQVKEIITKVL